MSAATRTAMILSGIVGSASGISHELASSDTVLRAPLAISRRIGFVSLRGGSGISATAGYAASLLAHRRRGMVLGVNASAGHQNLLTWSGGSGQPPAPGSDLRRAHPGSAADARAGLPVTANGLYALDLARHGLAASSGTWFEAVSPIARFFDVVVTDWGVRHPQVDLRQMAATSHVVCLVARADRYATEEAAALVPALWELPDRPRLVLALVDVGRTAERTPQLLRDQLGVPVLTIPYEPLRSVEPPPASRRLPARTRLAHIRLGAELMTQAHRTAARGFDRVDGTGRREARLMTLRLVHRPTRITRPVKAETEETIAAPPTIADGQVGGLPIQTFLPVIGAFSSVIMIVVLRNSNPLFLIIGGLLLVVALIGGLGVALSQRGGAVRTRRTQRENYLDFLEKLRARMRSEARRIREAAGLLDPEPAALLELIRDPSRLWERRRSHADFLRVRLGVGDRTMFHLTIPEEQDPVQPYDPIMINEANSVVTHYSRVRGMPVTVDLDRAGQVAIVGDRPSVLAAARSLVVQLAALHAPDDLHLAAAFSEHVGGRLAAASTCSRTRSSHSSTTVRCRLAGSRRPPLGCSGCWAPSSGDRAQFAATAKRSGLQLATSDNSRLVVFIDDYGRVASTLPVPDADLSLTDLQVTTVSPAQRPAARALRRHSTDHRRPRGGAGSPTRASTRTTPRSRCRRRPSTRRRRSCSRPLPEPSRRSG